MTDNIHHRAARWFNTQYNVTAIPVTGKKSVGHWEQYQRPIMAAEVDAMPWPSATGLAGICGVNDLVCVDFDHVTVEPVKAMINQGIGADWLVQTPSGGHHLWLIVPGLADLLEKGKIDRDALPEHADGGGKRAHIEIRSRGHYALLPPSAHPDHPGQYKFVNGWPKSPPPTVDPGTLLSAHTLITADPEPEPVQTGAAHAPTGDRLVYVAENCLKRLAASRCDDYRQWIGVGMALVELGDQGLALWDRWSQQSGKYKAGECAKAWKHIKQGGRTLKTLVMWAHQDSPSQPPSVASVGNNTVDLKSLMLPSDAINAINGHAPTWGAPRPVTDRSAADWIAIKWLIQRGATDSQIVAVFRQNPIGQRGKYATNGDAYLASTIAKARQRFASVV